MTVWITTNWKILQEMEKPDHLTCLLKNLYAGQEATLRIEHRTIDSFQIGESVQQGCILSPYLFTLYPEYIMQNAGLDESQARIKLLGVIPTTSHTQMIPLLMAECEEELKSLLMKVKEESEKAGLKQHSKN